MEEKLREEIRKWLGKEGKDFVTVWFFTKTREGEAVSMATNNDELAIAVTPAVGITLQTKNIKESNKAKEIGEKLGIPFVVVILANVKKMALKGIAKSIEDGDVEISVYVRGIGEEWQDYVAGTVLLDQITKTTKTFDIFLKILELGVGAYLSLLKAKEEKEVRSLEKMAMELKQKLFN